MNFMTLVQLHISLLFPRKIGAAHDETEVTSLVHAVFSSLAERKASAWLKEITSPIYSLLPPRQRIYQEQS